MINARMLVYTCTLHIGPFAVFHIRIRCMHSLNVILWLYSLSPVFLCYRPYKRMLNFFLQHEWFISNPLCWDNICLPDIDIISFSLSPTIEKNICSCHSILFFHVILFCLQNADVSSRHSLDFFFRTVCLVSMQK